MQGKAIIFSAPSGAGKTTIVHHLQNIQHLNLEFSVSACSRSIRGDEVFGVDYYFLSVEEFKSKIDKNEFIEWEEVYKDNFYGTLKTEVKRIWEKGANVIFDVDVVGGLNLKKYFDNNALSIFVMPPNKATLETRLRQRSTETESSIARRMAKADKELEFANLFDKILLNDNINKAFVEAEYLTNHFLRKNEI